MFSSRHASPQSSSSIGGLTLPERNTSKRMRCEDNLNGLFVLSGDGGTDCLMVDDESLQLNV